jgi:hypothetical protein
LEPAVEVEESTGVIEVPTALMLFQDGGPDEPQPKTWVPFLAAAEVVFGPTVVDGFCQVPFDDTPEALMTLLLFVGAG